MKQIAKTLLMLVVIGGVSFSSLYAQDYYVVDEPEYVEYSAYEEGTTNGVQGGWFGWLGALLAAGGITAVVLQNNSSSTVHS